MQYLLLATCCFLLACGNSDDDQGEVTVHFNHTVAGADLKHEEILYTNAAGNEYGVTRLEYIVSDIALETTGGKRVELAEFHYRNAFVSATRSVAAKVPGGEYTALRFTFGIDGAKNETGALPSVDHFNNMAWPTPMGGGYHYMRMEGLFRTDDGEGAFLTHNRAGGRRRLFVCRLPAAFPNRQRRRVGYRRGDGPQRVVRRAISVRLQRSRWDYGQRRRAIDLARQRHYGFFPRAHWEPRPRRPSPRGRGSRTRPCSARSRRTRRGITPWGLGH